MKITYIHQHFRLPDEAGGSRPWQFARRLARDGHGVTVVCAGKDSLRTTVDGVSIVRLGIPYENAMGTTRRLASFLSFMVAATAESLRDRADLIFASSTPLTVAVPARIASTVLRSNYIFEVRDVWPELPIQLGVLRNPIMIAVARALEKAAYSGAVEVVALSPSMADGVRKVDVDVPVSVIPNASDTGLFDISPGDREAERSRLGWNSATVVYAGSLGRSYDPSWLVRFAAAADRVGIRSVIVGGGAGLVPARRLANEMGLDPTSVLPGVIPKSRVVGMVAAADAVVSSLIPSLALEANSLNKVFDGFAAGRPIIFNHGGWLADLALEHRAGVRVDRNPEVAAEQSRLLLADAERVRAAGAASRSLADVFSRDVQYDRLVEVFERSFRGTQKGLT